MSKSFSNWDLKSCWTVRSSRNPREESSSTALIFEHEVTVKGGPLGIEIVAKFIHALIDGRARRNHLFRGGLTSLTLKRCRTDSKRIAASKASKLIFRLKTPTVSPQTRASVGGNASPVRAPSALSVSATGVVPLVSAPDAAKENVGTAPALPSPAAILPDQSCIVETDNVGFSRKNANSPKQLESMKIGTPYFTELAPDANTAQTSAWLRAARFNAFESTFASFSASDILRLSRDDLIQICGLADGIRLFNALHSKAPMPKLTLYFSLESNGSLWRVAYLDNLTSNALTKKLTSALSLSQDRLHSVLFLGPQGIHVLVTDELVANMKDESMYFVETIKDASSERYKLLLKSSSR
ncbi:hypothetical protein HZH68_001911 [Vespula germanica]|uniref:Uncharacterized protein n=1 Tax=Vespula germanica TaxID=30212 RepID=A0A834KV54_VESGE|nr:hypothetical protein HZH68_001911 [Vespula germanica]